MTKEAKKRVLDEQGNVTDLEGFAGRRGNERPPVPEDLQRTNKEEGAFYGETKDPEALYDKRRVNEEG